MYGKRLRIARKRADMTLEQVADILHTTHSTISRYENEKRRIDSEMIAEFCKLYNVSANYILGLPKELPHPEDSDKQS